MEVNTNINSCEMGDTTENPTVTATGVTTDTGEATETREFPGLSNEHLRQLREDSGISDDVIRERGYRTIEKPSELRELGFAASQCHKGLLIPLCDARGNKQEYQLRPDVPRQLKSKTGEKAKPLKYESPTGRPPVLDIPPPLKEKIKNPKVPLFVTEGAKKADAAVTHGLCCISVQGVNNFRGKNVYGGITTLPDFEDIALNGRIAYIVYDNDVMANKMVQKALERITGVLTNRGADVRFIYLPYQEGGIKCGLDDYLLNHSVDDLMALFQSELRRSSEPANTELYKATEKGLVYFKPTQTGPMPILLTNFTAKIVEEVEENDGAEEHRLYRIEAKINGKTKTVSVPSSQFAALNWVGEHLGASAVIHAGASIKDHVRAAIQLLSGIPRLETVYTHTGWRKIENDWVFLTSEGALGGNDAHPVSVELSQQLVPYSLPLTPDKDRVRLGIAAIKRLLQLGPPSVMFPLLASGFRAAFDGVDFSVMVVGATGVFKSEVAALTQAFYGKEWNSRNLPANWTCTANFLERLMFKAKNVLLIIDDFAPHGSQANIQAMHGVADRVFRGQGNGAGRGRLNQDATLKTTYYARGLPISTGEDTPNGQSMRARTLIVELGKGNINPADLTQCQQDAAAGLYAEVMADFLKSVAPRYEEFMIKLKESARYYRDSSEGSHRRTPAITGELAAIWQMVLEHWFEVGYITQEEFSALFMDCLEALKTVGDDQSGFQSSQVPALRFRELLQAALKAFRCHVATPEGNEPKNAGQWGYVTKFVGFGENERDDIQARGDCIGYVDGDDLYLIPDAAYNVAKMMGNQSGDGISIGSKTMHKRLHEADFLQTTDASRKTLTVRKILGENAVKKGDQ
jgi:hypothetical protein